MNGRIYDPTLGRFLQADPHIQAPKNSQSYNRYSYVLNNPLSYTDPSGYFFNKIFKALNKALGDFAPFISLALLFTPIGAWAATGLWQAATVGFVTGGIATGSLKGALIGAFSGAAFQQIGAAFTEGGSGFFAEGGIGHIGAHAVTGGVSSVLSGGKFGHGFFSAGLTKGLNVNGIVGAQQGGIWDSVRTATAAVIGGTISKVTGGKFANGAITAGFAQAVNGNQQARDKANQQRKKYFQSNSDPDIKNFRAGASSFFEDEFRVLFHERSLAGEFGEHYQSLALNADLAINSAGALYTNDASILINGESMNFRELVNGAVSDTISNNKMFFAGRTSVSVGVGYVGGRLFRYGGSGALAFTGLSLGSSGYGRMLNLYDQGTRDPVKLLSGGLAGN